MTKEDRENINPHKPAVIAMWLWGNLYSEQRGGSMDFWKKLSKSQQETAREMLEAIEKARPE